MKCNKQTEAAATEITGNRVIRQTREVRASILTSLAGITSAPETWLVSDCCAAL